MKTASYKSYSTDFKLKAIADKTIECNSNSRYYWQTKGNEKLLQTASTNDSISLSSFLQQKNDDLVLVFDELFAFFNTWIDLSKKTKSLFKKNRNKIVYLWEKLKPFASIEYICKWFNISERTYFNWKNRIVCKLTPKKNALISTLTN